MPRVLADLPEDDIKWLDRLAEEQGRSRAAVLREAVSAFRAGTARDGIEKYFGIWKDREDIGDAVDWQRRERASAARSWDPEYEDVKAEFPDLLDKSEDRQREGDGDHDS